MLTHSIYELLIQFCWGTLMLLWSVSRGAPWENFTYFFCLLVSYVGLASFDRLSTKTIGFLQILFGMGLGMISINEPNKVWLCALLISLFGAGCFVCSRKGELIIGTFEKNKKLLTTLVVVGSIMIYIVLIFFATPRNGVRAWLSLCHVSIQLTEIQKFLSAFLTGFILEEYKKNDFKKLALTLGTILFHVICLVICNELGTAVVILVSNLIVLFLSLSGKYRAKLLTVIGACSICLVSGYILAVNFTALLPENLANIILKVQSRIGVFLDPSQDRFGKGFQAYMSLSTIGAAGLFGIPLEKMAGINFPNLKNDYVFTALVLHGGLILGVAYFVSLISLVYSLLRESTSKHNKIAIGMVLHILIQTIVGVLGSVNLIPFSGIGLPFLSTGYSAYTMMLISILTVLLLNSDKRLIKDISMDAISKFSGITMTIGVILVLVVSSTMSTHIGSKNATEMDETLTRKISVPGTVLDANGYTISASDDQNNTTMVSHPSAYSWLVGYSDKIYGNSGLYSTFERYMLNKNSETVEMHLSIDAALQEYCYGLLDGLSGSITVLENKTGRILCLTSRDARLNYDINNLSSTLAKANELEGFLLANGFTENEAPGSVFKLITSVAALQSEYAEKNELIYYDTGEYVNRSYYKVHNFDNSSYGNVDLEKALVKSVNTYFAFLADHIGARQLRETAEQFAFNKEIRTDFTTMNPSIEIKSINDLTSSGFGQGKIQTCPLHIAMIGAALASDDGSMHIPYVVEKISNKGKTLYLGKEQTIVKSVCSKKIREELLDHLQKVSVSYGIANENEEVYSKTGTAQLGNGLNHSYLLTFDDTYTIVFSANDTTQTGGGLFKEKAKELRFYMDTFM